MHRMPAFVFTTPKRQIKTSAEESQLHTPSTGKKQGQGSPGRSWLLEILGALRGSPHWPKVGFSTEKCLSWWDVIPATGADEASYNHKARGWVGKWAPGLAWFLKHSSYTRAALIGERGNPQSALVLSVFNSTKPFVFIYFILFPFPSVKTRMQSIDCGMCISEGSGMVLSFESVQLSGWWYWGGGGRKNRFRRGEQGVLFHGNVLFCLLREYKELRGPFEMS